MAKKLKDLLDNLVEEEIKDVQETENEDSLVNDLLNEVDVETEPQPKKPIEQKSNIAGGWFKTGTDAVEYAKQKAIALQQRKERNVPIFYLKLDEEATVVFVDDKGFGIHQHKVKIGDRWISLTCVKDFAPCPICATGNRSSYVIYYTVIDTRPYTDKEGKTTKFRKVLFPATGSTLQMRIADEKEAKKTLVGAVCRFKRYSAKESSSGTLVENKGRIDIASKFGNEFTTPIDYVKVLAPPSEEELEALGFNVAIVGSDSDILGDLDV